MDKREKQNKREKGEEMEGQKKEWGETEEDRERHRNLCVILQAPYFPPIIKLIKC